MIITGKCSLCGDIEDFDTETHKSNHSCREYSEAEIAELKEMTKRIRDSAFAELKTTK